MEVIEAVDGTLGLEIVTFPIDGPWVLLLLFEIADAVDVRRPESENAVLNVVDASLIVDMDDVGQDAPPPARGGRKVVDPPLSLRAVGVLERTDVTDDLGLVVVLITEGVLDPSGVPVGVRGVTFVISVLGSEFILVGVVGSMLPVTVERAVDAMEAELGVNFESGRGPEGTSGLFDSCVGVTLGLKLGLMLRVVPRISDLTDSAADTNPVFKLKFGSLSFCEGVTLLFIVFLLSTLARNKTESASGSTLLSVAPAGPVRREGVVVMVVVAGRAL
ncbi:hypothetical protein PILCRDRAFT_828963 [Piloderma croceum F 1598]|uniref:Uncharacterized protein n=1 Tax=Piloderma croceum (strain F 1598) TaxID=765440 RepID=A0A0C3F172_PILCF|nr:hypothetical protein PILCRDRAFT_828963 [Piloderma croceum F 1598]